jgi:hypothetical protein
MCGRCFRRRGHVALYGELGRPQKYIEQMTSSHSVYVSALLQEICGFHNAFANEGVIRCGGCTVWVEATRNAAKPQPLETTCDEMMETERLKFQDADTAARATFGGALNRSPTYKARISQISSGNRCFFGVAVVASNRPAPLD